MNNWIRLGISALISLVLTLIAFFLFPAPHSPYYFIPVVYFFAPGSYLTDLLPTSFVNAVGDRIFPVIASGVVWALVIFGVWLLIAWLKRRSYR